MVVPKYNKLEKEIKDPNFLSNELDENLISYSIFGKIHKNRFRVC